MNQKKKNHYHHLINGLLNKKKNESIQIDQMFLMPSLCFDAILILTAYTNTQILTSWIDLYSFGQKQKQKMNHSLMFFDWLSFNG